MSFRLSGSNALSSLRRPRSLAIKARINHQPRATFFYSAPNSASAATSAKVLPSMGQAAAQEIVKKLETGDSRLQFTITDKQEIEKFAVNSFTKNTARSIANTELNQLAATLTAIKDDFASIKQFIEALDKKGLVLSNGKPITFTERWNKARDEYDNIVMVSQNLATSASNQIEKLIFRVVPALGDVTTNDEKRNIVESYISDCRAFQESGQEQELRFLRLRQEVDAFQQDLLSSVSTSQKDTAAALKVVDQKLDKLQAELNKSKGYFGFGGSDDKQADSKLHNLRKDQSHLKHLLDGVNNVQPNQMDGTFKNLSERLTAIHGIVRMLDSDAITLREDLGEIIKARKIKSTEYLKSSEYAMIVTYELFYSALKAYSMAVPK